MRGGVNGEDNFKLLDSESEHGDAGLMPDRETEEKVD